jgi:hypothetical protein
MYRILVLPLLLLMMSIPSVAQETEVGAAVPPAGDARVRQQLDELGYQYEIDDDGDFRAVFEFQGEKRSQVVYVNSRTSTYDSLEIREIWSPAIESKGPFAPKVANRLLEASFDAPLGSWQVFKQKNGKFIAVFAVKLLVTADNATLQRAINAVLAHADEMERELTKKDTY